MSQERNAWTGVAREATAFLPDVVVLFKEVARDSRVPRRAKMKVAAALAYLLSPIDLVADVIPGIGLLDDVAIVAFAARELLDAAGTDIVREHWRGSQHGLDVVLRLVDTDLRPRRMLTSFVADVLSGRGRSRHRRGTGRVIDGEIVGSKPAGAR
jgi:uncharacterized membrane protein YkvA (DUF1232 family)